MLIQPASRLFFPPGGLRIQAGGGALVYGPPIVIEFNITDDTYLRSDTPTTNYNTDTGLYIGESNAVVRTLRSLLHPAWGWFPATGVISSTILKLYMNVEFSNNARTLRVYRVIRNWILAQATWNRYATGLNWQTAGGFGALDCEQTDIGSRAFSATETVDVYKDFPLTGTTPAALDLGNGWMVKADTEDADQYGFISVNNASSKPKIALTFTDALSNTLQYSAMGDSKSLAAVANNSWPLTLTTSLNVDVAGKSWAQLAFAATSGRTVATMQDNIDANLAAITVGSADVVFCNLGANDALGTLPAEATWKADYLYILDALNVKWPNALCYITKPWTRNQATDCNTLAGWIDALVALRSFARAGDDERTWLEGGNDGVTMSSDGVHYSAAGQAEKVIQCKTLLGF